MNQWYLLWKLAILANFRESDTRPILSLFGASRGPPLRGGLHPPFLGGFGGYTPQKRQKWRSGPILAATANFGASIL